MAAVNIRTVEPATDSINPAILFECTIEVQRDLEILLACEGSLWCDDKRIGTASVEYEKSRHRALRPTLSSSNNDTLQATFHVPLTRHALSFLESYRDGQPSGDVELSLQCSTRSLELKVAAHRELILDLKEQPPKDKFQVSETEFGHDRMLLSSSSHELGTIKTWTHSSGCTISSSQWAQEFAPELGLGNFLLFEYPALTDFVSLKDTSEDAGDEGASLQERLMDATKSLQEVQDAIRRGEWDMVMIKVRDAAEVLKDNNRDEKDFEREIREVMAEDGLPKEGAKNITTSMRHLSHYLSKFDHRLERDGKTLMPRQKASKEDAYLAYTMGTAVVNLLTAKLKRAEDRPTS